MATNGFLARLTGGLMRARTLTAGSGLAISNPTGDAGDPTFSIDATVQLRCSVYNSAVQSIATATFVAITFDSEEYDVTGFHDAGSPGRVTVPAGGDGLYFYAYGTTFNPNATAVGERVALLRKNGTTFIGPYILTTAVSLGYATICAASGLVPLVAGDYFELLAYQDSGNNMDVGFAAVYAASKIQLIRLVIG